MITPLNTFQPNLPDFEKQVKFQYSNDQYKYEFGRSIEYGMGNYFVGFKLSKNKKIMVDEQIRSFAMFDFKSSNHRYLFLPFNKYFRVYDLEKNDYFDIPNIMGGLYDSSIYYQCEFDENNQFLLLNRETGFELYDLEKRLVIFQYTDENTYFDGVNFGTDNQVWWSKIENDLQQLIKINPINLEQEKWQLPSPFDFLKWKRLH